MKLTRNEYVIFGAIMVRQPEAAPRLADEQLAGMIHRVKLHLLRDILRGEATEKSPPPEPGS